MNRAEVFKAVLDDHVLAFRDAKRPFYCTGEGCEWHAIVVADGCDANGVSIKAQHCDHLAAALDAALAQEGAPWCTYCGGTHLIESCPTYNAATGEPGTEDDPTQEGDQGEAVDDEALVDLVAQQSYTESSNLTTEYIPWAEVSESNRERVREVIRDMLGTPAMRSRLVAVPVAGDEVREGASNGD